MPPCGQDPLRQGLGSVLITYSYTFPQEEMPIHALAVEPRAWCDRGGCRAALTSF